MRVIIRYPYVSILNIIRILISEESSKKSNLLRISTLMLLYFAFQL